MVRHPRRRLLVGGGLAAAVVTVAIALVVVASSPSPDRSGGGGPEAGGGPPSPQLAGLLVVTGYDTGGQAFVLDPSTGDYREVTGADPVVSPDLRLVASHHDGGILVTSTTDRSTRTIEVAEPVSSVIDHSLVWSPDSTMIAATTPYEVTAPEWPAHHPATPDGDGGALPPFYRLVLIDVPAGTARLVNLDLPRWYHSYGTTRTGRIGAFGGAPVWLTDSHLAAPVTSLPPDPDDIVNGDTVAVFDLTGALVREARLPDDELVALRDLPAQFRLALADRAPDGSFLLLGPVGHQTIALRGLPDPDGDGDGFDWRFDLPEPTDGAMWTAEAAGWLGDTDVLVQATQVPIPGSEQTVAPAYEWRVVDVASGETRQPDELVLPDGSLRLVTVGAAEWLSPSAAGLAF